MKRKKFLAAAAILLVSILGTFAAPRAPQEGRLAHANGDGKLTIGQEQFQIGAVVVKLLDDQKAEITIVSDITVFLNGTWSQSSQSPQTFDLRVTSGVSRFEGTGTVTIGNEPKDLRLDIKGQNRTNKRTVEIHFVGK